MDLFGTGEGVSGHGMSALAGHAFEIYLLPRNRASPA